jgi:hypothetical protein
MYDASVQRATRRRTKFPHAGAWAIAAVAVAIFLIGTAAGAPAPTVRAAASKSWSAPYTNGTQFGILFGSTGGCSSVGLSVSPFFNTTTGHGFLASNASARSCPGGNSSALWEMDAVLESPVFTTTTGAHHLRVNWSLSFAVNLSAHRGGVHQNASAYYEVGAFVQLVNTTTDTDVAGVEYQPIFTDALYSGTYSHAYHKVAVTSYFNATLSKTQHYVWEAYVYCDLFTFVTTGSSSAFASVNVGSGGNTAVVKSVSLT